MSDVVFSKIEGLKINVCMRIYVDWFGTIRFSRYSESLIGRKMERTLSEVQSNPSQKEILKFLRPFQEEKWRKTLVPLCS